MKKLCAVMLFVFVASLFAAGAAFAARSEYAVVSVDVIPMDGAANKVTVRALPNLVTSTDIRLALAAASTQQRAVVGAGSVRVLSGDNTAAIGVGAAQVAHILNSADQGTVMSAGARDAIDFLTTGQQSFTWNNAFGVNNGYSVTLQGGAVNGFVVRGLPGYNPTPASLAARSALDNPHLDAMVAPYVWRAARLADVGTDVGREGVAVRFPLDPEKFRGLNVSDINVIKVRGVAATDNVVYNRVYSASQLRRGTFAVVRRNVDGTDHVLTEGDTITAATSAAVENNSCQHFVVLVARPGTDYSVNLATSTDIVVDPAIIVANNPFVKTPVFPAGNNLPVTGSDATRLVTVGYGSRFDPRDNAAVRGPRTLADVGPILGVTSAPLPASAQAALETADRMYFVRDVVVERYVGAENVANVYKLPVVQVETVPARKVALTMFTIRDLTLFTGKTVGDLKVYSVPSDFAPANMEDVEYTFVDDLANVADGTFMILTRSENDRHEQRPLPATHVFTADGPYFVALAVRDQANSNFDVDATTFSNNKANISAFVFVGESQTQTLSITPTSARIEEIGGTQQLTASVNVGDLPALTWTSSDEEVATVDAAGLVTAVALGNATITATGGGLTATASIDVGPEPTNTPVPSGGSSGGCSVGGFAPAAVILLAPLFLLLKK